MKERWRSWLVRAEALLCTGMPGAYRVVVFASLQHVYSLAALGHTASDMSLAQLAAYFTAIGWASLILVRVPAAAERKHAVDAFYSVAWMAAVTTAVVSCAAFAVAALAPIAFDVCAFVLLLWGWSAYQLARHFFVALRSYRVAVAFDLLLMACSQAALYVCKLNGASSSTALALALIIVSSVMFAFVGVPAPASLLRRFDTKGLQFGMTNFLSGGITLLFVPIAAMTCGTAFAGGFSLLSSITAVAVLIPRAISTTQIPELTKLTAAKLPINATVQLMRRTVWLSNIGVLTANVILVILTVYCGVKGATEEHHGMLVIAGLLLATQYAVSMGSAVPSSVMMVFERARDTAIVNLKTTALFALSCAVLAFFHGPISFLAVLSAAIATSAARNVLVARQAKHAVDEYAERTTRAT